MESHGALVQACDEIESLCCHADARGAYHPAIKIFRDWMKKRLDIPVGQQGPHGQTLNAAVMIYNGLDLKDGARVGEWKKEVESVIRRMRKCEVRLQRVVRNKAISVFAESERMVVAQEREAAAAKT